MQVRWIHDRHDILNQHEFVHAWIYQEWKPGAPWMIRIFGESGVPELFVAMDTDAPQRARIKDLFPEADIVFCPVVMEADWNKNPWVWPPSGSRGPGILFLRKKK